jgi:putative ABC transport system permease protein
VTVKLGLRSVPTQIVGTTPAFPVVRRFQMKSGRFFDDDDDRAARRVVVLGARVADKLQEPDIVGKQVRIRGIPFDVVGVLAAKGVVVDGDEDDQVLVPARTALRRLFNVTWLSAVYVSAASSREVNPMETAITGLLARRHPPRQGAPRRIRDPGRVALLHDAAQDDGGARGSDDRARRRGARRRRHGDHGADAPLRARAH